MVHYFKIFVKMITLLHLHVFCCRKIFSLFLLVKMKNANRMHADEMNQSLIVTVFVNEQFLLIYSLFAATCNSVEVL